MRRNKPSVLLAMIICFAGMFVLRCSMPVQVSGGGSDTEVTGKIVNEQGDPAPNTIVLLIPNDFNPYRDAALIDSLPVDTTDYMGEYCFHSIDTGGIYNIQALHLTKKTSVFVKSIKAAGDTTRIPTRELTKPGSIRTFLSDTVDTADGYVFIEGSTIIRDLSGGSYIGGSYYLIVIDSVPTGLMPSVIYVPRQQDPHQYLLSNIAVVLSNDTTDVGDITKPIWRFSLLIAVDDVVSQYYGGLDSIKPLIEAQVKEALSAFNNPSYFDAIIHFAIDSIYGYSGDLFDEMATSFSGFDYRFLYADELRDSTGKSDKGKANIIRFSNIYLEEKPSLIFDSSLTRILIPLLAELRGCLHLLMLNVDSTKNPVNNKGYYGINSYMNVSYESFNRQKVWDEYSINIVNHNATVIGSERDILYEAFPDYTGILVKSSAGLPLEGADVEVYGSILDSDSINSVPVFQGTTGANGALLFPDNPFEPDPGNTFKYGNLLVLALFGGDTTYAWFPLFEASNSYFNNPDITFFKEISF